MKTISKPTAIIAFSIIILSSIFCPFLKAPIIGNWNLYELDSTLFFITYGILALCALFSLTKSAGLFRFSSILFTLWSVIAFSGVFFKINNFFGLRFVDKLLVKTIHVQWGWFPLFLGCVLLLLSIRKVKQPESAVAR